MNASTTARPLPTQSDLQDALSAVFAIEQKLPMESDQRRAFYRVRCQLAETWDAYIRNRPAAVEAGEEVSS